MSTLTPDEAARRVRAWEQSDAAVLERLGISVVSIVPGKVELDLHVAPSMTNAHGFCHGGFLFALADTAFAYSLASVGASPATLQATISFLQSAREGEVVRAIADVSRAGRKAVFATSRLYVDGSNLIAEFQGSGVNIAKDI